MPERQYPARACLNWTANPFFQLQSVGKLKGHLLSHSGVAPIDVHMSQRGYIHKVVRNQPVLHVTNL